MYYQLQCDDNFQFMRDGGSDLHGQFPSAEVAIAAAKAIVEKSLRHLYRPGMEADELYEDYMDFGDDPFIRTDDPSCRFSAWTYAESRCPEICRTGADSS